jgi:hypothetical protein
MDFPSGNFLHFPKAGGWHDQDDDELHLMKIAHRAYMVFSRSLKDIHDSRDTNAIDFMGWVLKD